EPLGFPRDGRRQDAGRGEAQQGEREDALADRAPWGIPRDIRRGARLSPQDLKARVLGARDSCGGPLGGRRDPPNETSRILGRGAVGTPLPKSAKPTNTGAKKEGPAKLRKSLLSI